MQATLPTSSGNALRELSALQQRQVDLLQRLRIVHNQIDFAESQLVASVTPRSVEISGGMLATLRVTEFTTSRELSTTSREVSNLQEAISVLPGQGPPMPSATMVGTVLLVLIGVAITAAWSRHWRGMSFGQHIPRFDERNRRVSLEQRVDEIARDVRTLHQTQRTLESELLVKTTHMADSSTMVL